MLIFIFTDSITHGFSIGGGYREQLYEIITNELLYNVEFLGSRKDSPGSTPDVDHEVCTFFFKKKNISNTLASRSISKL